MNSSDYVIDHLAFSITRLIHAAAHFRACMVDVKLPKKFDGLNCTREVLNFHSIICADIFEVIINGNKDIPKNLVVLC